MISRPKVSVLIPTYEYGRFLPAAIDSVLAQDFRDFELLISDDGSQDDSAAVIRRYAAQDSRVRYRIHERNLGMVENWNWCLREARGEYIKYVFGDDCLPSPSALRRLVAMLDGEPRASLAVSARLILDEASQVQEVWDELGAAGYQSGPDVIIRCMQRDRNLVGEPSTVLFRRIPAARGFDPTFRQVVDQEMWFHLLASSGLVYTPEPLCAFRRHPAQQTVANEKNRLASSEVMRIVARYFDFFATSVGLRPQSYAMRQRLFRHLYYARKDCPRTELAAVAESTLMPHVTRRWYFVCWVIHRLTKPFINLNRWLAGHRGSDPVPNPASAAAAIPTDSLAPAAAGRMSAGGIFPAQPNP
jgi:glycosyltransferase involved in cell wall biosynthesis